MKMSTKGRYGLRLMMELAGQYGNGPVLAQTIEKNQAISGKYLHVLVGGLKAAGLVRAVRGPSGGYELARAPSAITARDVVVALERGTVPVACVADAQSCRRAGACAAHDLWCEVAAAIDGVLSGVTLADLAAKQLRKEREMAAATPSGKTTKGERPRCRETHR